MNIYRLASFAILFVLLQNVDISVSAEQRDYSFQKDIRPLFDKKCISCHACYDAPCQLKLEDDGGIARGATKKRVYDGARLEDVDPTRLGVDAHSIQDWRGKGFFSVFRNERKDGNSDDVIAKLLINLARENPLPAHGEILESVDLGFSRDNQCISDGGFDTYRKKNPFGGMPLAVTGLNDDEYQALTQWIDNGAQVEKRQFSQSVSDTNIVEEWEELLNQKDMKSQLVARYLYEHLFLGHLYFDAGETFQNRVFYQLVRSSTASGKEAVAVSTIRPNNDPGTDFFYRLVPITSSIVHKTHITYRFDNSRLKEFQKLFFNPDWEVETLPGFDYVARSNPFYTFRAIPVRSRYQFLLNDAEFFIRTFIRGPVCRGQIATDVIRDQFWVMFQNPDSDQYIVDAEFRNKATPLLGLPGESSNLLEGAAEWFSYQSDRNEYLELRREIVNNSHPEGIDISHVWDGDGVNTSAHLSVFRHHNSASVVRGWQGAEPLTLWLMDYALFERAVYELVVGFNVFGSVAHQAQTRLYFDLIRNEAETNFLQLLPSENREEIYSSWYQDAGLLKTWLIYHDLDLESQSGERFSTEAPKTEVVQKILKRDLKVDCAKSKCQGYEEPLQSNNKLLEIANRSASELQAIRWMPEVTFVRVEDQNGSFHVFTLLRNRRHTNVAFMYGESLRYQEELDSLTVARGIVGSYPNLILKMNDTDVSDFVERFKQVTSENTYLSLKKDYGLRRMNPEFWEVFHSVTDYQARKLPLEAGVFDLNRYEKW